MALYVRYIEGPHAMSDERINLAPKVKGVAGRIISLGHGEGSRIRLPKGSGVSTQSAVIRRGVSNELLLESRQEGLLVRAAGKLHFKKLPSGKTMPLSHGQLIKLGPHLLDIVDSEKVSRGEDMTHSILLARFNAQEDVRPGARTISADWHPIVEGEKVPFMTRVGRAIIRPKLELTVPFKP